MVVFILRLLLCFRSENSQAGQKIKSGNNPRSNMKATLALCFADSFISIFTAVHDYCGMVLILLLSSDN